MRADDRARAHRQPRGRVDEDLGRILSPKQRAVARMLDREETEGIAGANPRLIGGAGRGSA